MIKSAFIPIFKISHKNYDSRKILLSCVKTVAMLIRNYGETKKRTKEPQKSMLVETPNCWIKKLSLNPEDDDKLVVEGGHTRKISSI